MPHLIGYPKSHTLCGSIKNLCCSRTVGWHRKSKENDERWGVRKEPGCSWIEVNKQVHAFFVGDRSHPQMQLIYENLEMLSQQMKAAGYAPAGD